MLLSTVEGVRSRGAMGERGEWRNSYRKEAFTLTWQEKEMGKCQDEYLHALSRKIE